jgi:hypothetical protein
MNETNGHITESLQTILARVEKHVLGDERQTALPLLPDTQPASTAHDTRVPRSSSQKAETVNPHKRNPIKPQYRGTDRIIRPELNVEKYASVLFSSPHAKNLHKEKTRTWKVERANGQNTKAGITVHPFKEKRPTTSTHKVLLTLEKLQEDKGTDENGRTVISLREGLTAIGWDKQSGRNSNRLVDELYRARFAAHILQNSFEDEAGNPIDYIDTFTYLDDLKILRRDHRTKEQYFEPLVAFRFHELIRNRLAHNKTKPTNYDVLISGIKGENAHLVYTKLDPILANKGYNEPFQIRARRLFFEDLLLEGEKYNRIGGRKQQLERITDELDEKPLSTGILRCRTTKTRDGTDYKLIAWKIEFSELENARHTSPANAPEDTAHIIVELNRLLKTHDPSRFKLFAHKYPLHPTLYQAMREYKADAPSKHDPLKYFQAILHRIVHQHGHDWIRPCLADCPQRET